MLKKKISKKGIDEKIATILLVAFIIALLVIAFLWGSKFIKQRASKELQISEKKFQCNDILITARDAAQTINTVQLLVENKKDRKIGKFAFRVISNDKAVPIDSYDVLNGLEIKNYELNLENTGIETADSIDIIPYIKIAKSNFVPCSDQHAVIKVTQTSN